MRTFTQKQDYPKKPVSFHAAQPDIASPGPYHRADLFLHLQRTIGNRGVLGLLRIRAGEHDTGTAGTSPRQVNSHVGREPANSPRSDAVRTKLAISEPGDAYEQEADQVAEQVMRMSEPEGQQAFGCDRECSEQGTEHAMQGQRSMRAKHLDSGAPGAAKAPPVVLDVVRSSGRPLDAKTRAFAEPRFGMHFGDVRVHSDARAAESASAVGARAYTVGRHIVLGPGRFEPGSSQGRRLLVHELAHVVQQGRAGGLPRVVQRAPDKVPVPKAPVPKLPVKIIPGSSHLSRQVQAYHVDHPNLAPGTNVVAFSYSVGDGPSQMKVVENREGVHSEYEMGQFLQDVGKQSGKSVTLIEVYSERQPCGPSEQDCEGMLIRRYPGAKVTFGYNYQDTRSPAPVSRAQKAKSDIAAARDRVSQSKQLEWDFKNPKKEPPPHFERNEPGPVSKAPRRAYSRWGSRAQTAEAAKAMVELEESASRSARLTARIQGYVAALGALQQAVSLLDTLADAESIFFQGTVLGKEQKEADNIESQSKEAQQAADDIANENMTTAALLMAGEAARRNDPDTMFQIEDTLIGIKGKVDIGVKNLSEAADDLEQHALELLVAAIKAKAAATYGTEDAVMAQSRRPVHFPRKTGQNLRARRQQLQSRGRNAEEL